MGWIRSERVTWAERALWAAAIAVLAGPVVLWPSPEDVARAYVEAINRGDAESALALTAEDVIVAPVMGGYLRDREEVRAVLEWRAALRERWRIEGWRYEPAGRRVEAEIEMTNDLWELLEHAPRATLTVAVGRGRVVAEWVRADGRELRRVLRPFVRWASDERPDELARAWRDGRPRWTPEAGAALCQLVAEWRAAGGAVAVTPEGGQP